MRKRKLELLYVAGRYRSASAAEVERNIRFAEQFGMLAAETGLWFPVIPHANTMHWERIWGFDDEFYLQGTMELMRRCDALLLIPGAETSDGAIAEVLEAQRLNMNIFYNWEQLVEYSKP